jgi:hypothetical protein
MWKSFHLGGSIKGIHIHDLAQDGKLKLIVHTNDRLFVFDARSHALEWESVESDFTNISTLALGEFDQSDDQHEFLILAGGVLLIYDGVRYSIEWQTENFGSRLGLMDIDDDGILEVLGESTGGKLSVFDIDKRQEKQDL